MSTNPFAAPASTAGLDYQALNGSLLLIEPRGVETDVKTSLGAKDAVQADVAVLDGGHAGTTYSDVLIFPKVLQSQLRSKIGEKVLGRLGQGAAKPGQNAPWTLAAPTEADIAVGVAWIERQAKPAVSAPAAASGKPPF